jgi:hypothetical protein
MWMDLRISRYETLRLITIILVQNNLSIFNFTIKYNEFIYYRINIAITKTRNFNTGNNETRQWPGSSVTSMYLQHSQYKPSLKSNLMLSSNLRNDFLCRIPSKLFTYLLYLSKNRCNSEAFENFRVFLLAEGFNLLLTCNWMTTTCQLSESPYSIYSELVSTRAGSLLRPQPEDVEHITHGRSVDLYLYHIFRCNTFFILTDEMNM